MSSTRVKDGRASWPPDDHVSERFRRAAAVTVNTSAPHARDAQSGAAEVSAAPNDCNHPAQPACGSRSQVDAVESAREQWTVPSEELAELRCVVGDFGKFATVTP